MYSVFRLNSTQCLQAYTFLFCLPQTAFSLLHTPSRYFPSSPMSLRAKGHLHDDVIILLRAETFRVLLFSANQGFCYLNLTGISKLKYERKNERESGRT